MVLRQLRSVPRGDGEEGVEVSYYYATVPLWALVQLGRQRTIELTLHIGRFPIPPVCMLACFDGKGCMVTPLGDHLDVPMCAPCRCGRDCLGWAEMDRRVELRRVREAQR